MLDLDAMKARVDKAHKHVAALCMGETRWTMHIPVDPARDSDLIITEGLCDADRLMDEVKRQRVRIEDLERELRQARTEFIASLRAEAPTYGDALAEYAEDLEENDRIDAVIAYNSDGGGVS